jgi:hypothetical protein
MTPALKVLGRRTLGRGLQLGVLSLLLDIGGNVPDPSALLLGEFGREPALL